jgi:hypothetical protein
MTLSEVVGKVRWARCEVGKVGEVGEVRWVRWRWDGRRRRSDRYIVYETTKTALN